MKTAVVLSLVAIAFAVVSQNEALACGFITGLVTSEERSLDYVGNIKFSAPATDGKVTRIPISFDGGKWLYNSGIALKKVRATRREAVITITVVTCLADGSEKFPSQEIVLQKVPKGIYDVVYQNPDGTHVPIGQIEI